MKKILALVLAVMMLATVAFAADAYKRADPGSKIKFDFDVAAGDLTDAGSSGFTADGTGTFDTTVEATSKTMSITNVKWTKGSTYVKSLTFNDDGQVVLELKQDYAAELSVANLALGKKTIEGSFKLTQKGKGKSETYTLGNTSGTDDVIIGYGYNVVTYILGGTSSVDTADEVITKIDGKTNDTSYETISFNDALDNDVEVRVYNDEKYFLYSDNTPDLDIVKKYDDTGADLEFVSWPAAPTFSATANYYIYAEEDSYIYTIKNGAITASGAKWSKDDGCWILKVRTLGNYVISDMKLAATSGTTSDTETTPNPDTGANDVVGIATALAAVALISAAAVSLKK